MKAKALIISHRNRKMLGITVEAVGLSVDPKPWFGSRQRCYQIICDELSFEIFKDSGVET